ncbi:MAG: hypothetical protein GY896_23010 [Gammaproteobacteria bacterium]|nr:hypothetical protein [Gammaproteobacteria bacterium]
MPYAIYWPLFYQGEGERDGAYSAEVLAELERPSSEFYKLLRIEFPQVTETLQFSPTSTELSDADTDIIGTPATKHGVLADPPDTPDEANYVRNDAANTATEDRYGFGDLPDDVVGVEEVRIFVRAATGFEAGVIEDDGPWSFALRVNGTNYFEDQKTPNRFFNLAHRTNLIRFPLNPDTGLAWTKAEFNALQASLFTQPDGYGSQWGQRHAQLWIEADVTRTRRGLFSSDAPNSRSEGTYKNRVMQWAPIRYSAAGFAIERVSTGARVADPDNELGALFAGKDGREARFSPVDLRYASPNIIDKTKWYTAFTGVLSSWEEAEPRVWNLFFRVDDDGLDSETPRIKITEFDFPDADPKVFSNFVQVPYGVHDTDGLSEDGAILCVDVDKIRFRRFVSLGIMKSVIRVYSKAGNDDPPVERSSGYASGTAATAGYRVINPIINGRQYTLLEFNVTGAGEDELFAELEITCDLEGVEDIGDGTGALVRNANAYMHFVSNFVFANYQSGNWLPTDSRLDADSFAEVQTFLNNLGQDTSRLIGGKARGRKAKDELADWAFQLRIKVFWEEDGQLAARPFSPFTLDVYKDDPWIREGLHDIEEPSYDVIETGIKQQIFINYIHRAASDDYLANIEVRDFTLAGEESETVEASWFRSALPEAP